jgi:hypothetical protein
LSFVRHLRLQTTFNNCMYCCDMLVGPSPGSKHDHPEGCSHWPGLACNLG